MSITNHIIWACILFFLSGLNFGLTLAPENHNRFLNIGAGLFTAFVAVVHLMEVL